MTESALSRHRHYPRSRAFVHVKQVVRGLACVLSRRENQCRHAAECRNEREELVAILKVNGDAEQYAERDECSCDPCSCGVLLDHVFHVLLQ